VLTGLVFLRKFVDLTRGRRDGGASRRLWLLSPKPADCTDAGASGRGGRHIRLGRLRVLPNLSPGTSRAKKPADAGPYRAHMPGPR